MYQSSTPSPFMSTNGIQGHLLEVTVIGCNNLKDTEWISRQDPYVFLEYGSTNLRTRTCTDGGTNPTFQEKFTFTLIEGLWEMKLVVWNSNILTYDDFIGSGKVQLQKVVSKGYDDSPWPLQTKTGRYAGEVRLIMHYSNPNEPATIHVPPALLYVARSAPQAAPQVSFYSTPLLGSAASYPTPATVYPTPSPYASYPPNSAAYPPAQYPPPQTAAYPPPYPPPLAYPPPPYPPPPQSTSYYPPGPYPGTYPPPPY